MIAYVRMQLLRWKRRTLGIGLLVAAVFLPTFMAALMIVLWLMEGGKQGTARVFVPLTIFCVVGAGGLSIANQVSALVQEESRLRRSTLLRVGSLDGFRAVGAYTLLGLVFAVLQGTLGYLLPALLGLVGGIPLSAWLLPAGLTVLVLSAFAPPAILAGFLLPRTLCLLLVNAAALAAGIAFSSGLSWERTDLSPGLLLGVLSLHAVCLAAGGPIWRARSASTW